MPIPRCHLPPRLCHWLTQLQTRHVLGRNKTVRGRRNLVSGTDVVSEPRGAAGGPFSPRAVRHHKFPNCSQEAVLS